ncbi:MAG: alanine/glycine:cation symporter family protein [Planctomycetota bacterium]
MNRPAALLATHLLVIFTGLSLFATSLHAQEVAPPEATAEAQPIGELEPPTTFQDRVDGVINPINKAIFDTLFFDLGFGFFVTPRLDSDGNVKMDVQPVFVEAEAEFAAVLVDENGAMKTGEDGEPMRLTVPAGASYQPVDAAGIPQTSSTPKTTGTIPFLVVWLGCGAVFFTIYHGFVTLRGMPHAIAVVLGRYQSDDDEGEVPPFRALTSALSATVGLGNIAGVAVAMVIGGPGALFWMMFLGFFGMASKFHETTLAQMFRIKNADGTISGGPMYTLDLGFKRHLPALWPLGKALAIVFALFCMLASLGGGNMFQSNQAAEAFFTTFVEPGLGESQATIDATRGWVDNGVGVFLAVAVAFVVLGGITRIGAATSRLVPIMAAVYVMACLFIVLANVGELPRLIGMVFSNAFAVESAFGGLIGAMMVGFQRAAFSSEAGVGSSAIAHAAAQTKEPVREGFVASLEPFIDTVVICFMTGMVVLITNAYLEEEGGAAVTLYAFKQVEATSDWFPFILAVSIVLFAFSTMISWCYYGERAAGYLCGTRYADAGILAFRVLFVACVYFGAVGSLDSVIGLADAGLLSMALPNILGGLLLAPLVGKMTEDYWTRLKGGAFDAPAIDEPDPRAD